LSAWDERKAFVGRNAPAKRADTDDQGRVVPISETAAPQHDGYDPAGTAPETKGQTEPTERG
jgi:hypothetical protein